MYRSIIFTIFTLLIALNTNSQNKTYANKIIEELSSEDFNGRGYIGNGDIMTARYIAEKFKTQGLKPLGNSFLQPFDVSINTFPDTLEIVIDGQKLVPGQDYYVGGGSHGVKGLFELVKLDTAQLKDASQLSETLGNKVVLLPDIAERDTRTYQLNAAGYVFTTTKKMIWRLSDATSVKPFFYIRCNDSIIQNAKQIEVNIRNEFFENYKTANVAGMVEGAVQPDSFYVFTAHFDHLGKMGSNVTFPGANDNASGTAMILDLARHMSVHKPHYSVIFMAFAAEECGLFGSDYMAKNLPVKQENIKFLFNLDMVGTGSEGIGMVNATEVPKADSILRLINSEKKYFDDIRSGGARCVSDHCAFAQKGIPSIFIFTRGKEHTHYHTPQDMPPIPLTKWDEMFSFLMDFMERY